VTKIYIGILNCPASLKFISNHVHVHSITQARTGNAPSRNMINP